MFLWQFPFIGLFLRIYGMPEAWQMGRDDTYYDDALVLFTVRLWPANLLSR